MKWLSAQKVPLKHQRQIRHRRHQFTPQLRNVFGSGEINRLPHHALITAAERHRFVHVSELPQNVPNSLGSLLCLANHVQRGALLYFPSQCSLKQPALERATPIRTLTINAANIILETGARLLKPIRGGVPFEDHTECHQSARIITRLQPHIGKENAVATHAAGRA